MRAMFALVSAAAAGAAFLGPAQAQDAAAPPFLSEIEAFEAADRAAPPAACQVLFAGSSSFRLWDTLAEDMAPRAVINRGFGGSEMSQLNGYFDRIVAPYRPSAILIYEGENDIAAGESAEQVAADVEAFMDMKTAALGSTPVYFVSIKASKLRWEQRGEQDRANALIADMAEARDDLAFIDVRSAMIEDGAPKDIFIADDLHMTAEGYAIWTPIVRAALDAPPESTAPGC